MMRLIPAGVVPQRFQRGPARRGLLPFRLAPAPRRRGPGGARAVAAQGATPRTFTLEGDALAAIRQRIAAKDPALSDAAKAIRHDAEQALKRGPWSVMDKSMTPPSGDKHDYMSIGPYWWPNPKTKDGLPYVRRDGNTNPERHNYDNVGLNHTINAVRDLSLAAYLFDEPRYAERAATLLRVWFLDEATRMNPHLEYGQAIPGRVKGRGIGIIDTHNLPELFDAVALLRTTAAWTDTDDKALRAWFEKFLKWMLTSKHGKDEARTKNNHAVWYDAQVAAIALFVDDTETANRVLSNVGPRLIAKQIDPDGRMPHELARTRSFDYTRFNLDGFLTLAELGRAAGVDVWGFATKDGRSIGAALDWLEPFITGDKKWTHKQIKKIKLDGPAVLFRRAARLATDNETRRRVRYEAVYQRLKSAGKTPDDAGAVWPAPG